MEVHKHLMVPDGTGGMKLPPEFLLIVAVNLNNCSWEGGDGTWKMKGVPDEVIGEFGDRTCRAMSSWHAP